MLSTHRRELRLSEEPEEIDPVDQEKFSRSCELIESGISGKGHDTSQNEFAERKKGEGRLASSKLKARPLLQMQCTENPEEQTERRRGKD